MSWFKAISGRYVAVGLFSAALGFLLAWPVFAKAQDKKEPTPDPTAKHAPTEGGPTETNKDLAEQIKLLQAKVTRLEAAVTKLAPLAGDSGKGVKAGDKGADQGARVAAKFQNCTECHQKRPSGPLPPTHLDMTASTTPPPTSEPGKSGPGKSAMPDPGDGKMKGMDMKEKGMGMDMKEKGMGMGMDMKQKGMGMGMMEMMGKGPKDVGGMAGMKDMTKMQKGTALPAFPGAVEIYHIGASDFFIDQSDHIKLTTEQQTTLNSLKGKALLAKSTSDRKIEESEQELWSLSGSDRPDATKLDATVREIEKLRGDQRLAFIQSVGDAAQVLTDDQRKALIGKAQPATPAPAAPPKTP